MDSCEVPPKRRKIGSGVGETSLLSSISKNDYEVFLSFRGPDTRQGFTDCLYHALIDSGICVFRDDDELRLGTKIDEILHALDNSKICIVVFSPSFPESVWCLREIERMMDMKKDTVPIFYYVTPDDVKLKTELYTNALTVHEIKYGKEQVQQWRDALKAIPTMKGRELKNTGYTAFSKQIAKEILTKLKVKHKYEIKNFVELPDEVEAALKLLAIGSDDERRFVGIHGMGGIGKTTLAKIIYNQILDRFDCSCFLENIRDYSSQSPDGLHKLQERLLKSLDPSIQDNTHIVDPMTRIQMTLQRKKVFIVLDDIDQIIHLENLVGDSSWFGEGSRIIFTTRNAQLHVQTTSCDAQFYGFEKKEMDYEQALTLFSHHAFGVDSPPKDFESLSTEAISNMGGLPLALEVVGSFLHRKKPKVWRDVIKKLKKAPHQDVQRKLKLNYDALEVEQQEIFLDIACFFIGEEKKNAVYMWEASTFYPDYGIEVLISMSLIKLNENKCFLMHDQLRDLGRAIVNVDSKDVRAGSRLWSHTDAVDLLKTNVNVGKEKVEALSLEEPAPVYLGRENFVGLKKLKFLRLVKCGDFGGDFGSLIPKLKWLSLLDASSFSVTNLYLRELVVLELSSCGFDENWPGWGQILISKQLKVLTLSNCNELISTPDLSKTANLERLVLKSCGKLTSIHSSLGKLQLMTHFSIIECYSLLWQKKKCHSLHDFPEDLASLKSLKQIVFSGDFSENIDLPESIGCLVSLTILKIDLVSNLPNSIGELVKLKHLSLRYSEKLRLLPDSIGDLRSLISLDLLGSGIIELPVTIGRLTKLESLCLRGCRELQRLPDSIKNLHSLIDLDVSNYCSVELDHSFGQKHELIKLSVLQRLKTLRLGFPSLEFGQCELPSNIETLVLHVKQWGKLPSNLSSMKKLRELDLGNFVIEEADCVQGLECLEVLEMRSCCLMFNEFPVVKTLRKMHLDECQIKLDYGFFKVVGAEGLESSLVGLNMVNCIITRLDITQLNHLVYLVISGCEDLVEIQGIGKLKSLTQLYICDCDSLRMIEDLSELNRLAYAWIFECKKFERIENVDRLLSAATLYSLYIRNCKCDDLSYFSGDDD